jgi:Flp pilus assembly protein TadG
MDYQWTVLAAIAGRFAGCRRGAVTVEFTLIAAAMLIGIAVAVGDIGTSLMASRDAAAGSL